MTKSNPKISVIVPIYNAEKYLHRCIDSILNQTFIDFEVLLIDDGSTDSSGVICDEYVKKDCRVRVFHKENGGVASARNVGLDNLTGDYVVFVDSDDLLAEYALSYYLKRHVEKAADIVVSDYTEVINNQEIYREVDVVSDKYVYLTAILNRKTSYTLWAKSFKATLFKNKRFISGCDFGEDFMIYPKVVFDSICISKINSSLYTYYRDNNSSYTKRFKEKYLNQLYIIGEDLVSFFYKKKSSKIDSIIEDFAGRFKIHLLFMTYSNKQAFFRVLNEYDIDSLVEKVKIDSVRYSFVYKLLKFYPKN